MVLIVTEQNDLTADLVVKELERRGTSFARLNSDRLLTDVSLSFAEPNGLVALTDECGTTVDLRQTKSVWYRRVAAAIGPDGSSPAAQAFARREALAQLLGAVLSLDAYWMSRPDAIWRANHKLLQLRVAQTLGLTLPVTMVTSSPDRAFAFWRERPGRVIAKPVSHGLVEGEGPTQAIYTNRLPPEMSRPDFESVATAPVIFQEEVPKRCDVRVTIVGRELFPVAIDSQDHPTTCVDWRRSRPEPLNHRVISLPQEVGARLLKMMDVLGLEFGAVDMVEKPDGTLVFLEINPSGQWGWIQVMTGLELAGAMAERLTNGARA